MENIIEDFKAYLDKKIALGRAVVLFDFDQSTGAPEGGSESRAKIVGILAAEEFKMGTSDCMKNFLDELSNNADRHDEITSAMVNECRKEYEKNIRIPADQFQAYSQLVSKSGVIWEKAKEKSDFQLFAPYLKEIIEYQRRFINYRGYEGHPYNTILDDYEPGMTIEKLDVFFEKIKATVVPMLKEIKNSNKKIRRDFLNRQISVDVQRQISQLLIEVLGFDLNRGMIRESEHPFTTDFGQNDVRITTHYHEDNVLSSFYSVIHEIGHALYEQNKMQDIADTILDSGISMGIHESQSRFYENVLGRSVAFWIYIYPRFQNILGTDFSDVSAEEFYEAANIAEASLIRIEADELTYPLHVMVRYEIEKEIFAENSSLDVNDLPELWNKKMNEYLGLTPPDDAHGVLQDVHWSQGSFGYFPSYALGSAYAAQLFSYMERDVEVEKLVEEGNISELTAWLTDRIHRYGRMRTPSRLIRDIRGEDLDASYYVDYLSRKFKRIYGLIG